MVNENNEKLYPVIARTSFRGKSPQLLKMVYLTRKQVEKYFPKEVFQWISFENSLLIPREYMLPKDGTNPKRKKFYLTRRVDGGSSRIVIEISLQKFFHLFPEGSYQILTKKCQYLVESKSTTIESSKEDSTTSTTNRNSNKKGVICSLLTNVKNENQPNHNTDYNTVPIHLNNDNFSLIFRRKNPFQRSSFSRVA